MAVGLRAAAAGARVAAGATCGGGATCRGSCAAALGAHGRGRAARRGRLPHGAGTPGADPRAAGNKHAARACGHMSRIMRDGTCHACHTRPSRMFQNAKFDLTPGGRGILTLQGTKKRARRCMVRTSCPSSLECGLIAPPPTWEGPRVAAAASLVPCCLSLAPLAPARRARATARRRSNRAARRRRARLIDRLIDRSRPRRRARHERAAHTATLASHRCERERRLTRAALSSSLSRAARLASRLGSAQMRYARVVRAVACCVTQCSTKRGGETRVARRACRAAASRVVVAGGRAPPTASRARALCGVERPDAIRDDATRNDSTSSVRAGRDAARGRRIPFHRTKHGVLRSEG